MIFSLDIFPSQLGNYPNSHQLKSIIKFSIYMLVGLKIVAKLK